VFAGVAAFLTIYLIAFCFFFLCNLRSFQLPDWFFLNAPSHQLRNLVFALWKRGAYLGDPWCTFGVANAYEEGIGVDKGKQFVAFSIHFKFEIFVVLPHFYD
jgi:hypothetical protein